MNTKRLILAIVVAFVVLWVTDFLIHGVWMVPDYRGTQQLWRTDAAMGSRMKLDGSLFRNLGNHHVCRRSYAGIHRRQMVLCWHLANNPARPRHLFCLQTQVGTRQNVV